MAPLPEFIRRYMGDWLIKKYTFGYILLDSECRVCSWGGDLPALGIGPLCVAREVTEQLIFTEGLLPTQEPSVYLPMLKGDGGQTLDVHLLRKNSGYGLLLIDATEKERQLAKYQQDANETALKQKKPCLPTDSIVGVLETDALKNFFKACNFAALQFKANNKFTIIGEAPDWLERFCPFAASQPCTLDPKNVFSFLDNFIVEAQDFWSLDKIGCIKSGIWIEIDESNREHLFEAIALNTGQYNLLLISNENILLSEKKGIIQRGREIALGRNSLESTQTKLKIAHDDLNSRFKARRHEIEQATKRLEEELVTRRRLEKERTEILLQLQQSQKMEAIGTLAGGIAHDFNNILSAVIGFTELSLFDTSKDSPLASNLRQVLSAAQRAKALIRQILTFSRQGNPETQPIQLIEIVEEALKLLRASLPATVEITQDLRSNAFVLADATQVHQVVMNLCTNASQAMSPKGGELNIRLQDKKIDIDLATRYQGVVPGSFIEMIITDNGSGMTKETLGRIFDPFFTTKEKGQGTGMGLSVVHGIVKNCKGDILVTSKVGKGTSFKIILPTVKETEILEIVLPSNMPKGTERILFIDDEPAQADLALKMLPTLGYKVTAMTDSTAALKLFIDSPDSFDLVITDMYMPKMTGNKLAMEILKARPNIPIVLSSGYSIDLVAPKEMEKYFKGHLMKPFLLNEMANTIRKVIDCK